MLRTRPSHGETPTLHQRGTKAGQHLEIPPNSSGRPQGRWDGIGEDLAGRWGTQISHKGREMLRAGWSVTPQIGL